MKLGIKGIEVIERELDAGKYLAGYRDEERFEALCRECPNYGRRWGCPPFDDNPQPSLLRYSRVRLMLLKVVLEPAAASSQSQMANALQDVVQRVRGPYEALLLGAERESRGRAALFTGMCPHCGHGECARCGGAACRHSELVRPSLEALGFDIGRTASELLGVDLLWATNEKAPAYVCLVGALFYP